jgi:hypothetical protein
MLSSTSDYALRTPLLLARHADATVADLIAG